MMAARIIVVLMWIGFISGALSTEEPNTESQNECPPYNYCQGENLPNTILGIHFIQCDSDPEPRDNCCLPQEQHKVCYNIRVDGQFLNFDQGDPSVDTDFNALCAAILETKGLAPGNHATVSLDRSKGGQFSYSNNQFHQLQFPSSESIKDLACGFAG